MAEYFFTILPEPERCEALEDMDVFQSNEENPKNSALHTKREILVI